MSEKISLSAKDAKEAAKNPELHDDSHDSDEDPTQMLLRDLALESDEDDEEEQNQDTVNLSTSAAGSRAAVAEPGDTEVEKGAALSAGNNKHKDRERDCTSSRRSAAKPARPGTPVPQACAADHDSSRRDQAGAEGIQIYAGYSLQHQNSLAEAVHVIIPGPELDFSNNSGPQFPLHAIFAPVDSFNAIADDAKCTNEVQSQCWEKLIEGEDGHVEQSIIDLSAKALVTSGLVSEFRLPLPSAQNVKHMDEADCGYLDQNDQDDNKDSGFLFTRGFHERVKRLNLRNMGPSVNQIVRADRILVRDIYGQRINLQTKYFPAWMKTVDPITVFRRLFLDDETIWKLTDNSNEALRRIDCNRRPLLRDATKISYKEMETYILATFLMLGYRSDPRLTDDPPEDIPADCFYNRFMIPRDRMIQISHVLRFKEFGQSSDNYVKWLNFFINSRLGMLHRRLPKVLAVQSYVIGESEDPDERQMRRQTRSLYATVVRAGYVLFRMQFHFQAEDTQSSGFHVSPGVSVLQRLFAGVKLAGRYVTMAGETTLEAAEFFHKHGARFVGSTGPLPASLKTLETVHSTGLVLPQPPRCTFHFEPSPGLRETVLMRYYELPIGHSCPKPGYLKMPRSIISEPHILCNIGGGSFVPLRLDYLDRRYSQVMIPLNCFLMMRNRNVNSLYEHLCRNYECFDFCCLNWHQKLMLHALFSGFMACWMNNAAANGRIVSHRQAGYVLLEKLLETIIQRQDDRHQYCNYISLLAGFSLMRDSVNSRLQQLGDPVGEGASSEQRKTPRPQAKATVYQQEQPEDTGSVQIIAATATATSTGSRSLQFSHQYNVRTQDGKIFVTQLPKRDQVQPENVDVSRMNRGAALSHLHRVNISESRMRAFGSGLDCDWIRDGIKLPDDAFDDLCGKDDDSSDHDSEQNFQAF